MQAEWGDPVPFFELILPPRGAKAAVPILAVISVAALATLALRPPRTRRAPHRRSRGSAATPHRRSSGQRKATEELRRERT